MGWLKTIRVNRAAKKYARRLPALMKRAWGFSDYYTPRQIRTSVTKLRLNPKYIAIGYAGFLPEEQFNQLQSEMSVRLSYSEARTAFFRYFPAQLWTASWEPQQENSEHVLGLFRTSGSDGSH